MAKITIAGDAVVISSSLKLEDIQTVQKYNPGALSLMGGKDNKETIFSICATTGAGSINSIGASFGRTAHDGSGTAVVTMTIPGDVENVKEWAADTFGTAVTYLGMLEESIPGILEDILAKKQSVMGSIVVQ